MTEDRKGKGKREPELPERLRLDLPLQARLPLLPRGSAESVGLYGEQRIEKPHGRRLAAVDLINLDLAWRIASRFAEPLAVLVNRGLPLKAATAATIEGALERLYRADEALLQHGAVGLNQAIDEDTARLLATQLIDSVIAPRFSQEATQILQKLRKGLQLFLPPERRYSCPGLRTLIWGPLAWADKPLEMFEEIGPRSASRWELAEQARRDLSLARHLLYWTRSSAAVVVKNGVTLAIAAGQPGPLAAVELALRRASFSLTEEEPTHGAVLAMGEPATGRELIDLAGVAELSAILLPRSGKHDPELIRAADEHRLALVLTEHSILCPWL